MAPHKVTFQLTVFEDRQYNNQRLVSEIRAAFPSLKTVSVVKNNDDPRKVDVVTDRALTAPEQSTLFQVLSNHESDLSHLPTVKAAKFRAIDVRTKQIIAKGFVWSGQRHSLSENAQKLLQGMDLLRNDPAFVYPVKVNTLDDSADAILANATELHNFVLTALGTLRMAWESGTVLKDLVRAATTVAEVSAIKDTRS